MAAGLTYDGGRSCDMDMYETLTVESVQEFVVRITLDRPDAMNALNTRMGEELSAVFTELKGRSPSELRVVVLTGSGERAFCAGADLKERDGMTDAAWKAQHVVFEAVGAALSGCPVPMIAAVNGVALGGGCEIALACDFIVASDTARFGQPESLRGIMPGLGGTQRLPRRIGPGRARELLYTGRLIGAADALAWGLANRIVPLADLAATTMDLAKQVAAAGPLAVRAIKQAVTDGLDQPLAAALATELRHYNVVIETEDRREGIRAFNEKRPPRFSGR